MVEPPADLTPEDLQRGKTLARRLRIATYVTLAMLLLGAVALRVQAGSDGGDDAVAAGPTRWVSGTTSQGEPVAIGLDGEGVPRTWRYEFRSTCSPDLPKTDPSVVEVGPAEKSSTGRRAEGRRTVELAAGPFAVSRVEQIRVDAEGATVEGTITVDDAWRRGGRRVGTCRTGRVSFELARRS